MGRITIRKVGDIVECKSSDFAPQGSKGIITMELVEDPPPDYEVYWFNLGTELVYMEDIRQCKGVRSKKVCISTLMPWHAVAYPGIF